MPVKGKGGKKHKKGKKNPDDNKKNFILKEDGQEYGQVTAVLGNCRFRLLCADGKERLGIVRGKMRKRQWVKQGSFVIVGLREFENDKCDIFHVYKDSENNKVRRFFSEKTNEHINDVNSSFVIGDECDINFDDI